jgi:hypothetical protein
VGLFFVRARRQAVPEWSINDSGVDRPVNSTAAGGASSAGVTREHHGYFGPFARANTQVFHLVYDGDQYLCQHLPSSTHPVEVAIVTVAIIQFLSLFRVLKTQFFLFSYRVS